MTADLELEEQCNLFRIVIPQWDDSRRGEVEDDVGAGYRLLLTDWLALRIDVRDHIFESDLLGEDEYKHNLEAHTGLSVFF